MSGSCGAVELDDRPIDRDLFARMMSAFAISAPDGSASLIDSNLALGYAHLRTDRDAMLPATLDGRTFVTGDIRLDDREALADLLGAPRDREIGRARVGKECRARGSPS